MKLFITLSFSSAQPRPFDASWLQGIFYNSMSEKIREKTHGVFPGLFVFSNIFVEKTHTYSPNTPYRIVFSSVDEEVVSSVYEGLIQQRVFPFGPTNSLTVKKVLIKSDEPVWAGKTREGLTPLCLSVDKEVCDRFGIEWNSDKPLFWTKDHGFDVWKHQLHKNIGRKYVTLLQRGYGGRLSDRDRMLVDSYEEREKFDALVEDIALFSTYQYKRNAVVPYKGGFVGGSVWNLVTATNPQAVKILRLVAPIGFGERCSAGFGFMR